MSLLILSYIVDEVDAAVLSDNTNAIEKLVEWTKKATENEIDGRFLGFSAIELIEGLTKLAANDENKIKIVEKGALPVLLRMLQSSDPEEQRSSAECVWMLGFHEDAKPIMLRNSDLVQALTNLQSAPEAAVRKNVQGALWLLTGDRQQDRSSRRRSRLSLSAEDQDDGVPYIFLSYSWSEQELAKRLKEAMTEAGFKMWIDVEQMGGSTLQTMAEALEGAGLVLICGSERYQESPNCRLEAEYTFTLKKPFIPIKLQRNFEPSSWLGAMFGAKMY
ncbi:uncharacterized protein LOC101859901, partial [Aplysia californica]|uniref:Uncharacterized protein LOC101859901 n=1 Tax=Aplysia californica TaxID=6500 RepID=A0ABM1ADK2_APLCA